MVDYPNNAPASQGGTRTFGTALGNAVNPFSDPTTTRLAQNDYAGGLTTAAAQGGGGGSATSAATPAATQAAAPASAPLAAADTTLTGEEGTDQLAGGNAPASPLAV